MKPDLFSLKNKTPDQLKEFLSTLSEKQTQDLKEQQEYYLLCYPQGTGDNELEELLSDLDQLWYPEYHDNN
jgi:hypothetical protein